MLTKLSISLKIDTYLRPLSLKKNINNAVYFPTNPILYDKIKKIKKIKRQKNKKKTYPIDG
jgi:ribosomal protein L30/L7E